MAFGSNGSNGTVTVSANVEITARFNQPGRRRSRPARPRRPLRRRLKRTMTQLGEPHHPHTPGPPPLRARPHGVVLQVHVVQEERHCTLAFEAQSLRTRSSLCAASKQWSTWRGA